MTIAGGIMGALFHRERTGEATTVDVSLLATGIWSMGAAFALSLQLDMPWAPPPRGGSPSGNPLVANYKTKDDRFVSLCCLQPGKYWPEAVRLIGLPELADDERFADAAKVLEHGQEGYALLAEAFAERTLDEWRDALADFSGQWAVVQNTLEAAVDPQAVANGYISELETSEGVPFQLATAPVQYDEEPARPGRAPEFNEHGDAILEGLGLDWDTIVELKVKGVVA
jgi:crotonobetainyl-CoA:carnitine CoA-transferase CaiB-like acyl-CoA transferase